MRPLSRHWLIFLLFLLIASGVSLKFALTRAHAAGTTYTVNSTADTDDGVCDATNCTLREAVNAANNHGGAVTINFSVSGTIALTSRIDIVNPVTIDATGQTITLDGGHQHTVLVALASLSLNNLTITNGSGEFCNGAVCDGGGLYALSVTLTITNCTFSNNSATRYGGGIALTEGSMVITNSTFTNNTAGSGGGVCAGTCTDVNFGLITSHVSVTDSTFSNNVGEQYGGAMSCVGYLTITNSSF